MFWLNNFRVTEKALAAGNVRVNERIVKKKSHNVREIIIC